VFLNATSSGNLPLLPPHELSGASAALWLSLDGALLLRVALPAAGGALALAGAASAAAGGAPVALRLNGTLPAIVTSQPNSAGPPTVSLALPVTVPWEAGVRALLPPMTVPVESFALLHRLLLEGGRSSVWCPQGTGWPVPVPAGHYSVTIATPALGDAVRDGVALAEPGTFAVAGVRRPCGAGLYGNASGLARRSCSGWCPASHACPTGSALPVACAAGSYAPAGSSACITCPVPSAWLLPGAAEGVPAHAEDPGARAAGARVAAAADTDSGRLLAAQARVGGEGAGGCRHARSCCGL
jgi:hypothetical protein